MTYATETDVQRAVSAQHILIVFHDFSAGGTEIIALKLAREWVKSGRKVTILCGTYDGPLWSKVPNGVDVVALSPEIGRSLLSRLELRRRIPAAIDRIAPDLVFLPGNFHLILAGAIRKTKSQPVVVAKISNPLSPPGRFGIVQRLTSLAFRKAARDVDWLVAMSSGLMAEARATTRSDAISVIFDPNVDDQPRQTRARSMTSSGGPIRLLAAGRLVPQKDFALAIRIVAELSQTHDVQLTILGEGPGRAQLERLAKRLGVEARVAMPGYAASIIPALTKSDLLLVTSRYEGGPAVAVEALEQGVPVITTDCSHFLRDLLSDPACGKILATRDARKFATAILAFIQPDQRQHFTPSTVTNPYRNAVAAENYLHLFDRLMQKLTRWPVTATVETFDQALSGDDCLGHVEI